MDSKEVYIGPKEIMNDWNVSKNKAYVIIRNLNAQLLKEKPTAITVAGKVNKRWYEDACLKNLFPENLPNSSIGGG